MGLVFYYLLPTVLRFFIPRTRAISKVHDNAGH